MKEELTKQLNNLIAFIRDANNYFAFFGKVMDSCAVAQELNRIAWGEELLSDEQFTSNSQIISRCKDEAINVHLDWTIRYLDSSPTKHTRKSLVMTIYNDIYQKHLDKE